MRNENQHDPQRDDVISALKQIRPAASTMDPSTVFYRAGFEAGQRNSADGRVSRPGSRLFAVIAATVVAASITGPAGYRIGQVTGRTEANFIVVNEGTDAQKKTIIIEPNTDRPIVKAPAETPSPTVTDDRSRLFARWIERWRPTYERTNPEHESTTLAVAHTTMLSQRRIGEPWPEFGQPHTAVQQTQRVLQALAAENEGAMRHTFAVGDTNLWAQVLEVSR